MNIMFTQMSKRLLRELVEERHVEGWDDPRMPTLAAFRRRGYTPESIRDFVQRAGLTKKHHFIELGLLESCIREDLNERAPRRFAVLDPLRVVIENYPEGGEEWLEAANHPNRPELGSRRVPFCRELLIERDDFMEDAPKQFHRLRPGGEVRLRYGYIIKCESVVKDAEGRIVELRCSYDPATKSGSGETRKVKGTIHWVSERHALRAEVRLYDRLFAVPYPGQTPLSEEINPKSLEIIDAAALEPALADAAPAEKFQFERLGYFSVDERRSEPGRPSFNRTVTLRDSWAKIEQQALGPESAVSAAGR
jgi:glutaminyl-tRNA synthetase